VHAIAFSPRIDPGIQTLEHSDRLVRGSGPARAPLARSLQCVRPDWVGPTFGPGARTYRHVDLQGNVHELWKTRYPSRLLSRSAPSRRLVSYGWRCVSLPASGPWGRPSGNTARALCPVGIYAACPTSSWQDYVVQIS